jgi:hypothetical protein
MWPHLRAWLLEIWLADAQGLSEDRAPPQLQPLHARGTATLKVHRPRLTTFGEDEVLWEQSRPAPRGSF